MFDTEVRRFIRAIASPHNAIFVMIIATILGLVSFAVTDGYNEVFGLNVEGFSPISEPSRIFNVDQEVNIPTWFIAFLFLYAALLALVASFFAARKSLEIVYWRAVSALCVFLSLNEVAGFHELLIDPIRGAYNLTGIWYQSWTIVGITLIGLAGIFFFRFFWSLPWQVMTIMVLGGFMHITGSIGFEMIGGNHLSLYGYDNFYVATATAEEFLEMMGVSTFLFGIMVYIRSFVEIPYSSNAASENIYEKLLHMGNNRFGFFLDRQPRGVVVTQLSQSGEVMKSQVEISRGISEEQPKKKKRRRKKNKS